MPFRNQGRAEMVDPRDLRNLLAVYKERHFSKAATKIGVSQPAITKSVQRLEKRFGVALFDRSRSQVEPTAVCESIVSHARLVLAELTEIERVVQMLRGLETGSLAVGFGPAMSESYVTEALGMLAQDHPGVQLEVRVDHWKQLSDWLIAGEIDLLIADLADAFGDGRFLATPLPPQEFVWFCRRGHPLSDKTLITRTELMQYPLATPRMPPWAVKWFTEGVAEDETGHIALPTIRCESYSALKRIVLGSQCVSVALARTIQPELENGSLTTLSVDAPKLQTNAGIVQMCKRTPSPLAKAFTERIEALAASD